MVFCNEKMKGYIVVFYSEEIPKPLVPLGGIISAVCRLRHQFVRSDSIEPIFGDVLDNKIFTVNYSFLSGKPILFTGNDKVRLSMYKMILYYKLCFVRGMMRII